LAARIDRNGRAQHLRSSFFFLKLAAGQDPVPDFSISVTASCPDGYQISHCEKFVSADGQNQP